jgi:hypothetical protein
LSYAEHDDIVADEAPLGASVAAAVGDAVGGFVAVVAVAVVVADDEIGVGANIETRNVQNVQNVQDVRNAEARVYVEDTLAPDESYTVTLYRVLWYRARIQGQQHYRERWTN